VEHEPCLFFKCHAGHQIRYPALNWQAPIFVGIELAVVIQILEGEAPNFQQRRDASFNLRLFGCRSYHRRHSHRQRHRE